jgi:hypothetical protein
LIYLSSTEELQIRWIYLVQAAKRTYYIPLKSLKFMGKPPFIDRGIRTANSAYWRITTGTRNYRISVSAQAEKRCGDEGNGLRRSSSESWALLLYHSGIPSLPNIKQRG